MITANLDISSSLSRAALRARLVEIDIEIEQLKSRVAQLEIARNPITAALDSVVYPILTLPVDITSEIFKQYLSGLGGKQDAEENLNDVRHLTLLSDARTVGPLFLSQVCSSWRNIVLNTPSMWCCVGVPFSNEWLNPSVPDWHKLLHLWLSRTGGHALYLDLAPSNDCRHTQLLLSTASHYSFQWRSFSGSLDTSILSIIDSVKDRIPLLHKLKLKANSELFPISPVSGFSIAPELREVELYNLSPTSITLPWRQLTHLTLERQTLSQCVGILHQTPLLEVLSVQIEPPKPPTSQRPTPITLYYAHTFKLLYTHQTPPTDIFPYLTLPRLATLEVMSSFRKEASLVTFLKRSQCVLLSLSTEVVEAELLIDPTMNQLQHLIFSAVYFRNPGKLVNFFLRIATDPAFLPCLQSFRIPVCEPAVPYPQIAQMLRSRWYERGSMQKLESFRLIRDIPGPNDVYDDEKYDIDVVPDSDVADTLQALIDDGLDIHIRSWHQPQASYHVNRFRD
ncbi:F-box domain-containing protein [Favolaschia claudopus]|uniref:F-box domain-containing protein n=1 Tax=Favolaschia claudopus TaxID=2862362 RepID=A0AAW0EFV5_9AGAR